jgi:hypothetical protein
MKYRRSVLAEMKAEAGPGRCFICDAPTHPLPVGRTRDMCRADECRRTYMRLYHAERRAEQEVAQ